MEYQLEDLESTDPRTISQTRDSSNRLNLDDVIIKREEFSTLEDVVEKTSRITQKLKEAAGRGNTIEVNSVVQALSDLLECTSSIVGLSANLDGQISKGNEKGGPCCSEDVGKLFFPGLMQSWRKRQPNPLEKNLSLLTEQYLEAQDPDRLKELSPTEFLQNIYALFAVQFNPQRSPAPEYFVRLSEEKASQVAGIDRESAEIELKLKKMEEINNKSRERSGKATFEEPEATLRNNLAISRARVAAMLPDVSDVSPMAASQAMQRVAADIAITPVLLGEILHTQDGLERIIVRSLFPSSKQDQLSLSLPCINGKKIASDVLKIEKEALSVIAQSPEMLADLVKNLATLRGLTRELIARALQHPAYSNESRIKIKEYLQQPFSRVVKSPHEILARLVEHPSPLVQVEGCRLAADAIPLDSTASRWGYLLEAPENMRILKAVSKAFLTSQNPDVVAAAREVMSVSETTKTQVLRPLDEVRKMIDKNKLYGIGKAFDDALLEADKRKGSLEGLTVLTGLQVFSEDINFCPYVKLQLPNIDLVKKLSEFISKRHEEIESKVQELARTVTKSLSHSLSDYYLDEDGVDLKEFIDDYMYYLKHPDALKGVSGNSGIRSAMLIYGRPGTGKTYFVECLENETGLPCKVLSASAKDKGEDKLDYLKKVIQGIKTEKKPCILLIDEAESTVLDRTSPMASSEDRHVTNYLLQEINELRKKHPYVLTVIATNYIERIDDAILRPGRVDIYIEMKPMSEAGRRALILRELIQEKIEVDLNPTDWEELMKITEGFIPICISKAIVGTNKISLPRRQERDSDAVFDKELLFRKLKEEGRHYSRFLEIVKNRRHGGESGGPNGH